MPRRKQSLEHRTFPIQLGDKPGVADLDAFTLIKSRMLVCANSGGGKSYLLRRFAEQVAGKIPTIIIDPEGEFSTLREEVDVVLVGPDGEVPASVATAGRLARRLIELRVSAVIDLYSLPLPEKQKFVKFFIEALLNLPRNMWARTFIILDEVHKFAPETERDVVSRDAVISLMDQGRKRHLGAVIATQRLSKLAASARAEANNVFVGRTAQDLDLRRAADLMGFNKAEWQTIKEFDPGEFYAFGPAFQQRGVLKFRSGKVKTTHDSDDLQGQAGPPRPSNMILRVAKELSDLQQEVEKEKDEMTRLREENHRLRSSARAPATVVHAGASRKELADAEKAGWTNGHNEGIRQGFERGWDACKKEALTISLEATQEGLKKLRALQTQLPKDLRTKPEVARVKPSEPWQPKGAALAPKPPAAPKRAVEPTGADLGRGAPFKIITVLVEHGGPMSRAKAAFLAGLSPNNGNFKNALSTLRTEGLMQDVSGGDIVATEDAVKRFAGNVAPLPKGRDLLDYWKMKFGGGAPGKIFTVLVDAGGPISREDAANAAGLQANNGNFKNALSTLRTAGVMKDTEGKHIMLAQELTS
jgi:regulator of replication initiation timing